VEIKAKKKKILKFINASEKLICYICWLSIKNNLINTFGNVLLNVNVCFIFAAIACTNVNRKYCWFNLATLKF